MGVPPVAVYDSLRVVISVGCPVTAAGETADEHDDERACEGDAGRARTGHGTSWSKQGHV
ncbi:hypothetical protein [Streptomyces sp. NPDC051776]|uniref:hypothetical protein n=1 Tax=Streptomyces sp. NPDC051776 TaxID=3155414 RepID=UPI0034386267